MANYYAILLAMLRLTEIERKIIGTLTTRADLDVKEMSSILKERVHVVRHALSRLQERGILRPLWVINSFKLGWERYNAFFSFRSKSKASKAQALKYLSSHPSVAFFSDSGADYDYEISIFGKSPREPMRLFEELSAKYGASVTTKTVCTRTLIAFFPRKYLAGASKSVAPVMLEHSDDRTEVDELDIRLLRRISQNPSSSRREIAQSLGLPHATVDVRFRKLRTSGVISGKLFAVNNSTYGASSYLLLLYGRGFDPVLRRRLFQFAEQHPHCTHYIEGFGSWDYELGVEVTTHREIVQIREEIEERFGAELTGIKTVPRLGVLRFESMPPYSGVKSGGL